MRLYIGLLHYPVYNKNYERIASAITNLDLHDLSRLAKTYGVKRFFVITPLKDQQSLAERILRHWTKGYGARYNRDRKEALDLLGIIPSLEDSIKNIKEIEGEEPLLIATDASRQEERFLTYSRAISLIKSERVIILIFGTGWGLDREIINRVDYILEPIEGCTDYNHLSVRTAAAIILDRLVGRYQ
ncbi:MAG: RNA methyltransferase [Thermodesulfobacteriota bacterium]|nr:RNA methyltransferase [Thermodesulfobacteriota bacterium]